MLKASFRDANVGVATTTWLPPDLLEEVRQRLAFFGRRVLDDVVEGLTVQFPQGAWAGDWALPSIVKGGSFKPL